jgi:hypothetical protein
MSADVDSYLKRTFSMIFPLIAIPLGRIQLYQKPISMRFGERTTAERSRTVGTLLDEAERRAHQATKRVGKRGR